MVLCPVQPLPYHAGGGTVNPEERRKAEELLLESIADIPDARDREWFLDWACRGETQLKERVVQLLESRARSESFFDFAPVEACIGEEDQDEAEAPLDQEIGLRVGKYRLIRRLGEGGYGVVYLAEQETPVRRLVALKLIRVGLDHEEVSRRFESERQALAMMDHPGIARVLDAGTTALGKPYFVMQWVTGERITDFCDKFRLPIRQRLELFVRVCHAIQHAHQKGVIHRDIKPSNILVSERDGTPLPKVIDFGIAKATEGADTEVDGVQKYLLGTPDYMSPEQAMQNGASMDTRSDLFSLGVLLCELIVGATPFGTAGKSPMGTTEIRRLIPTRHALSPSQTYARLSEPEQSQVAEYRGCRPRELARILAGDLDAIVLKCVETDPKSRYNTAHSLAADVMHHLNDEPVGALPANRSYRFAKLLKRNKLAFTSGLFVFAALSAGFGTSTILFLREKNARSEQARLRIEAENSRSAEAALRKRSEARELCTQAAVRLMYGKMDEADEIAARIPEHLVPPSLEAADLFGRLGDWHVINGRWAEASRCFSSLVESFSTVDPSDTDTVSRNLLPAVAAACEAGDWPRYERLRKIAIQRFGNTRHPVVAEQIIKVCMLRQPDDSIVRNLESLRDLVSASLSKAPDPAITPNLRAWAHFSVALWFLRTGKPEQAIQSARQSLETESLNPARVASVRLVMALAHERLGDHSNSGEQLEQASSAIRPVLETPIQNWSGNPQETRWPDWANAHILLLEAEAMIGVQTGK